MRLPALLLAAALTACAPFPQLDALDSTMAPPPPLLPIDELLAQAGAPANDPGPAVTARAARLKARAAAIPTPIPAP